MRKGEIYEFLLVNEIEFKLTIRIKYEVNIKVIQYHVFMLIYNFDTLILPGYRKVFECCSGSKGWRYN